MASQKSGGDGGKNLTEQPDALYRLTFAGGLVLGALTRSARESRTEYDRDLGDALAELRALVRQLPIVFTETGLDFSRLPADPSLNPEVRARQTFPS